MELTVADVCFKSQHILMYLDHELQHYISCLATPYPERAGEAFLGNEINKTKLFLSSLIIFFQIKVNFEFHLKIKVIKPGHKVADIQCKIFNISDGHVMLPSAFKFYREALGNDSDIGHLDFTF